MSFFLLSAEALCMSCEAHGKKQGFENKKWHDYFIAVQVSTNITSLKALQPLSRYFFYPSVIMKKHWFHVSVWRTAACAATCHKTEAWCEYFENEHHLAALSWLTLLRGLQCDFNWHCGLYWRNVASFERKPSRKGTRGAQMEQSGNGTPMRVLLILPVSVSVRTSLHNNLPRCNSVMCLNPAQWIHLQFITVTYQHLGRRLEVNYVFCSLCRVPY